MSNKLDSIDLDIISLLQEDGRMPCAEIARRIGYVTERVVRFRIDRLVRNGNIKIQAIVNPVAIGYTVLADVWVKVETGQVMKVAEKLQEFPQVTYVACSTGDRDISMQVIACSNEDMYKFVTDTVGSVPGVKMTGMVVIPKILKDIYDWKIPSLPEPLSKRS